jgi:uncharacterized protein (DUF1778 family)
MPSSSLHPSTSRTARIEARITPEALKLVKRAAGLQRRSLSDFVVASAQAAAYQVIDEAQIIHVTVADQNAFVEAFLNPPEPTPALRRAFQYHSEIVQS